MSTVSREIAAPVSVVWDVLADPWLYASWVVGAARVRGVDGDWPSAASRLHHSVGLWPLLLNDSTEVEESVPGGRLQLLARGWPGGEARVLIELAGHGDATTTVTMHEDAVSGPGRFIPSPVRQASLHVRNVESLRRLAYLAEGRNPEPAT
jgi:uncharacterized protein YndB with AHSA1/START domain